MRYRPSFGIVRFVAVAVACMLGTSFTGFAQETAAGCPIESKLFHECAVAKARTFNPPKLADGTPDFRGYWETLSNGVAWDFEPREGHLPLEPPSTGLRVDGD